jgi:hypothetical protein
MTATCQWEKSTSNSPISQQDLIRTKTENSQSNLSRPALCGAIVRRNTASNTQYQYYNLSDFQVIVTMVACHSIRPRTWLFAGGAACFADTLPPAQAVYLLF